MKNALRESAKSSRKERNKIERIRTIHTRERWKIYGNDQTEKQLPRKNNSPEGTQVLGFGKRKTCLGLKNFH